MTELKIGSENKPLLENALKNMDGSALFKDASLPYLQPITI